MHFLVLKVQRGLQQHLITTMYRYGSPGDTQSTQGAMLGLKAVSTYCRKAQPSCMHMAAWGLSSEAKACDLEA